MSQERLNEIIDFAIEREKEAVSFYQDLQSMTNFSSKKKLLKDLEKMEQGHVVMLEQLRHKKLNHIDIQEIEDLHISDWLVPSKPTSELSYQDILALAIKKEEKAYNLYNELAMRAKDETSHKLFLKLASEEAKHKHLFETIYDDEILNQD